MTQAARVGKGWSGCLHCKNGISIVENENETKIVFFWSQKIQREGDLNKINTGLTFYNVNSLFNYNSGHIHTNKCSEIKTKPEKIWY